MYFELDVIMKSACEGVPDHMFSAGHYLCTLKWANLTVQKIGPTWHATHGTPATAAAEPFRPRRVFARWYGHAKKCPCFLVDIDDAFLACGVSARVAIYYLMG